MSGMNLQPLVLQGETLRLRPLGQENADPTLWDLTFPAF
jgi:hypothetical protein